MPPFFADGPPGHRFEGVLARDLNRRLYGGIREAAVPEDPFESRVLVFDQIFVSKLEEVAARVVPRAHLGDGPATGPPYFKEQPFGFGQRTQRLLIRPAAEPIMRRVHPFLVGPQVVPVPGNRNVARVAHDVGSTDRAVGEELVAEISAVHEQIDVADPRGRSDFGRRLAKAEDGVALDEREICRGEREPVATRDVAQHVLEPNRRDLVVSGVHEGHPSDLWTEG